MKSGTLPSFWEAYFSLDKNIKASARKAYYLWRENPFHPSLHFKCINENEDMICKITRRYVGCVSDSVTHQIRDNGALRLTSNAPYNT